MSFHKPGQATKKRSDPSKNPPQSLDGCSTSVADPVSQPFHPPELPARSQERERVTFKPIDRLTPDPIYQRLWTQIALPTVELAEPFEGILLLAVHTLRLAVECCGALIIAAGVRKRFD